LASSTLIHLLNSFLDIDLNVNGKQYDGEENVMTGFREHLKNLATFYTFVGHNVVYYLYFVFHHVMICIVYVHIEVKSKKNLRKSLGDVSGLNWPSRGMKKRN
jgi:hypothetical protein